jgi:DNA-binding transcriptional ArsR family regulator
VIILANVLKEVFGDTKRISILEELVERWGEFLTVSEIARMAETSQKTVYNHLKELENINILDVKEGQSRKYKLKEDDKRALALAILEGEEYVRKAEVSLKEIENEELLRDKCQKAFYPSFNVKASSEIQYNNLITVGK